MQVLKRWMIWGALLALAIALAGCAQMFTSKTRVSVHRVGDSCIAVYESDKDQVGLEAEVCGGKVRVDKAGTPEAVIAAVLQSYAGLLARFDALMAKLAAAPVAAGS